MSAGDQRRANLTRAFESAFGREPILWTRAPGRVDLMGSHTDYNEGYVLTMAIGLDTWIAAAPSADNRIRFETLNLQHRAEFSAVEPLRGKTSGWGAYVRGVVHVLREAGYPAPGFDAVVHGDVPIGGGLSSSASLECATAVLIEALGEYSIGRVHLAQLCQRAENEVAGMQCGVLDQYSSLLAESGNAVVLDCRSLTHTLAPIAPSLGVVICDTRAPRQLTGSEYGHRRAQCEEGARILAGIYSGTKTLRDVSVPRFREAEGRLPEVVRRRSRFIVEENQRVLDLAAALSADDRPSIGKICADSFAGARDLFEISIPAMEAMIGAVLSSPGIVGARQAGAGFGGCMVAFVARESVAAFCRAAAKAYESSTGIRPEFHPIEAAAGAGLMEFAS